IPEAPDPAMSKRNASQIAAARARYGLPERYLVWVGNLEHPDPTRHVAKLAATSRELPLVLVGSTRPWAHELPGVTLTGHVPDDDLAAIYSGAHALVLAAEDEGFSLPAVEALACGTPVVACEVHALREVLDGRVTFVEPGDLRGLSPPVSAAPRAGIRARRPSVSAAPREHGRNRLEQDREVERQRPVLEVEEVEVHEVVEVELRAARNLPQPRDAGEHEVALAVP